MCIYLSERNALAMIPQSSQGIIIIHLDLLQLKHLFVTIYRLPVTRWVKLSLNFEFLVPK